MVEAMRQKGITDEAVLKAMSTVERHWFLDSALDALAYEDRALKIGCEQTISHPSTVAMQSQLARWPRPCGLIRPTVCSVLIVGQSMNLMPCSVLLVEDHLVLLHVPIVGLR